MTDTDRQRLLLLIHWAYVQFLTMLILAFRRLAGQDVLWPAPIPTSWVTLR